MSLIHQSTSSRTVWMKHRKIWALQLRSYLAHQLHVVFLAMVTALFKANVANGALYIVQLQIGLYRIYFFPIRPEPDFQTDCNFTNLMCKTLRTYE